MRRRNLGPPRGAARLLRASVLLAACGLLTACAAGFPRLPTALEAAPGGLRGVAPGTYKVTLIYMATPALGGVIHSVILDRADDGIQLLPQRSSGAESVEWKMGPFSAREVAERLPRLDAYFGAETQRAAFHEMFRKWELFPISLDGRPLGYVATVDALALFQIDKKANAGRLNVYYQDSSGFADKTGSGGGPGGASGGAGGNN
ncbi:MAG: hypothetical protein ACE5IM_01385 [Nitrospinota bacterium]